ncbi:MAG: hypothetical protein WAU78_04585 [Roseiarcus sp.]|jgi:hypothetical protein
MRPAQIVEEAGKRTLIVTARGESRLVKGARPTLELARRAIEAGAPLRKLIAERGGGSTLENWIHIFRHEFIQPSSGGLKVRISN